MWSRRSVGSLQSKKWSDTFFNSLCHLSSQVPMPTGSCDATERLLAVIRHTSNCKWIYFFAVCAFALQRRGVFLSFTVRARVGMPLVTYYNVTVLAGSYQWEWLTKGCFKSHRLFGYIIIPDFCEPVCFTQTKLCTCCTFRVKPEFSTLVLVLANVSYS